MHSAKFKKAVQIELIKRDWDQADLARRIGRARPNVCKTINGSRQFPIIRRLIIKTLKLRSLS